MKTFLNNFRLRNEREDVDTVIENVNKGVIFKGTNLWILVFAIFIASLGLNVNSAAVVIGAMLVSPLMGPILGLGLGMAINDLDLLKKALSNYFFALVVGLTTSTIFFLLSPLSDTTSEILSRTSPNIYDVLIAFFGGFAGVLAVSSKQKANVIPGVAIATALMPPLCTAGYGLANGNFKFLSGALYLFIINTVFIALATLITARFLKFPLKHLPEERDELMAKRIVWGVVIITLLPSIYFGYDIVKQNQFRQKANRFVDVEAVFPNDYLLKKTIDGKAGTISLVYGGEFIDEKAVDLLKSKLPGYGLDNATLEIKQGFSYLKNSQEDEQTKQLTTVLNEKEKELQGLKEKVAATEAEKALGTQIFTELKATYPSVTSCMIQRVTNNSETDQTPVWLAVINFDATIDTAERGRIVDFLKARVKDDKVLVYFIESSPAAKP